MKTFAERELEILEQAVPDALILPFKKQIISLCKAFSKSGQSGGSAPYVAGALSKAIENLMLHKPISPITGEEVEWNDVSKYNDGISWYQNNRDSRIFKNTLDGQPYFLDAIVWQGEEEYDTFTGNVYYDDHLSTMVSSKLNITLPITPKTFYIDVVNKPIDEEEAIKRDIYYGKNDKGYYYTVVKNPSDLEEVYAYYS